MAWLNKDVSKQNSRGCRKSVVEGVSAVEVADPRQRGSVIYVIYWRGRLVVKPEVGLPSAHEACNPSLGNRGNALRLETSVEACFVYPIKSSLQVKSNQCDDFLSKPHSVGCIG